MIVTKEDKKSSADIKIESINKFVGTDLSDICDATESTIIDNSLSFNMGVNRTDPPVRERLEAYWKGVLLVPERQLIVGRLDGVISSSVQLIKPSASNQASSFAGSIEHHFVAPWARGHGIAKSLMKVAEHEAMKAGLKILKLSVRANLTSAIKIYDSLGYKRWGVLDKYEIVDGKMLAGYFYYKDLV